ncbi:hypothetical protein SmphiM12_361 [Sinorhizobium phage phiM12]|nr:hypothetical protein AB690_gp234 [Sinorhizobium phage phiM12]AGR47993.1 hypothetical protein SmphiM12_361 [Sinorhizobium phage phiM12]
MRRAIEEFQGYVNELSNGDPTSMRIAYIRNKAEVCEDLMNACNNSDATLSRLLTSVFQLTN